MESIKLLKPPDYTEEERHALVDFVLALKKPSIQGLLRSREIPTAGAKPELRERLEEALAGGVITHEQLVEFLDSVAPWGKQHVFPYKGPRGDLGVWKNPDSVHRELKRHHLGRLFNARFPVILPEKLTLSSVTHTGGKLRVSAVQKKEYSERASEHDKVTQDENGRRITLRAYLDYVSRTLVAFEWDLVANTAMVQITQLKRDMLYEEMAQEFFALVAGWLDIGKFEQLDISPAIDRLREFEKKKDGRAETRSHVIDYRSLRGYSLSAKSPSARYSVLGDDDIDTAMTGFAKKGVGHLGNFYWLPGVNGGRVPNPLNGEVHTFIVGSKRRINFPTANTEEVVRYVLHRVRALS